MPITHVRQRASEMSPQRLQINLRIKFSGLAFCIQEYLALVSEAHHLVVHSAGCTQIRQLGSAYCLLQHLEKSISAIGRKSIPCEWMASPGGGQELMPCETVTAGDTHTSEVVDKCL